MITEFIEKHKPQKLVAKWDTVEDCLNLLDWASQMDKFNYMLQGKTWKELRDRHFRDKEQGFTELIKSRGEKKRTVYDTINAFEAIESLNESAHVRTFSKKQAIEIGRIPEEKRPEFVEAITNEDDSIKPVREIRTIRKEQFEEAEVTEENTTDELETVMYVTPKAETTFITLNGKYNIIQLADAIGNQVEGMEIELLKKELTKIQLIQK